MTGCESEVKWCEAASRTEIMRRQPTDMVIGARRNRALASHSILRLEPELRYTINVTRGLHPIVKFYSMGTWECAPEKVYYISLDENIDQLWSVESWWPGMPPRMPGSSPERKYSENCIKGKTGDPYMFVCRRGVTMTLVHVIVVVSCHRQMLGKCSCSYEINVWDSENMMKSKTNHNLEDPLQLTSTSWHWPLQQIMPSWRPEASLNNRKEHKYATVK